jgi:hypothetical protein
MTQAIDLTKTANIDADALVSALAGADVILGNWRTGSGVLKGASQLQEIVRTGTGKEMAVLSLRLKNKTQAETVLAGLMLIASDDMGPEQAKRFGAKLGESQYPRWRGR